MSMESKAKAVAHSLYSRFLETGSFTYSREPRRDSSEFEPSSDDVAGVSGMQAKIGYAGLMIQTVGYEKGAQEPRVHVYVNKGSDRALKKLQEEVDGVLVQVNNLGNPTVKPEASKGNAARGCFHVHNNRVACGSSCAPTNEKYTGTIGAIVRKKDTGELFILSNNHVLGACNQTVVGAKIMAPGTSDDHADLKFGPVVIARHSEITELRSGVPTLVTPCTADLAIAKITDEALVTSWQGDDSDGYDTPSLVAAPKANMVVKKFGRTTGLTTGVVEAFLDRPTPLPYDMPKFRATVWFRNVWTVTSPGDQFALPGDSGSLVVSEDGSTALGIIFAADKQGRYAVIIPMDHAITHFNGLELVGSHGV